jgi:hypothetical protein
MRRALLEANLDLLRQGAELLGRLDQESYRRAPAPGGGIGAHFRHVLDFYACFTRDVQVGLIDYDRRPRDPEVEFELVRARRAVEQAAGGLVSLNLHAAPERLLVKTDAPLGEDERAAVSSLERELQFLASHTVHHYALIALLLRLDDLPVPARFGVAPSTLRYWRESGARAH